MRVSINIALYILHVLFSLVLSGTGCQSKGSDILELHIVIHGAHQYSDCLVSDDTNEAINTNKHPLNDGVKEN